MGTEKLNLYQKLAKIGSEIRGLGKDKDGELGKYKYVTGDKVLDNIKPLMVELGIILKQEILSIDNVRQDYATKNGHKSEILSKVMMRFTWVDCDSGEKDENLFGANGQNGWDKGVGSALTYGERYFLLKFFHIATDEDDIDNPDSKNDPKLTDNEKYILEINTHKLNVSKITEIKSLNKYYNTLPEHSKADKNIVEIIKQHKSTLTQP